MLQSPNIGIALRCKGNPSDLIDTTRSAEKAGFDSVWLVEVSEADDMALAGALSQATQNIKIATGVVNSNLRLPTLLAMAAATVSLLSNGRFILGIGAGDPPMTYTDPLRENNPSTRLSETLQILRLCLTGNEVHFEGKLYRVDGFRLGLRPTNKIPIFGAAMGLKMVEMVAPLADGVLTMLTTLEHIREIKQTIQARAKKFQLEKEPAIACHILTSVSEKREVAEQVAKQSVLEYLRIPVYHNSMVRMGFSEEVQDLEATLSAKKEDVWKYVSDDMVGRLIVYGTPEECIGKINAFVKEGVTHPIIYPCTTKSAFPTYVNETIRLFAPFILKPHEYRNESRKIVCPECKGEVEVITENTPIRAGIDNAVLICTNEKCKRYKKPFTIGYAI
jgi:5,10-methylenetetrahydromethanopterin reductase